MANPSNFTITLERRLLQHPRAYHLRRMRQGIWLYLEILAQLPAATESVDIDPAAVGDEMGLSEGTVRSWLGHLRKAGYVAAKRLNGTIRVSIKKGFVPEPPEPERQRFFTVPKLERMLKDRTNAAAFESALKLYPDAVIRRAVAGALAPPEEQIRRSRTALFLYLVKRYGQPPQDI